MKLRSLARPARLAVFLLLLATVVALAANNAAWASSPQVVEAQRQPGRSTVPRRGTDLEIFKSYRRVWWGGVFFTLVVTNNGPIAAQNVVVTDRISRRLELYRVTTSKGVCFGDRLVECHLGNLAVGEVVTITIHSVIWLDRARGTIRNTAEVDSRTRDTKNSNNSATVIFDGRSPIFPWFDRLRPIPDDTGSSDEDEDE